MTYFTAVILDGIERLKIQQLETISHDIQDKQYNPIYKGSPVTQ